MAGTLRRLARIVETGLVVPEEVCGKTALTLIEPYKYECSAGGLEAL